MAVVPAKTRTFVKQLVQLSLVDGRVSSEQVAGILEYLEQNPPSQPVAVLQAFHKAIAVELAKGEARVEHSGPLAPAALAAIAAALSKRYARPVSAVASVNSALLAGVRVRIGDDVYESSVAGQLAALSAAS